MGMSLGMGGVVRDQANIEELIPPVDDLPAYARGGDFRRLGEGFVGAAAERGLRPGDRVLDLGCGVGRFAVGFAGYVDEHGSYEGLDVAEQSVELCRRYIGSRLPRFGFHRLDAFNSHYNPGGVDQAASVRFPFEDASFDFVFSNSLFTHLLPSDAEHYLVEIGRVLRPGGRALDTIFLLNAASNAALDAGRASHELPHVLEGGIARIKRSDRPEAVIAFDEDHIRAVHDRAGLRIEEVGYGAWAGGETAARGLGEKDFILASAGARKGG